MLKTLASKIIEKTEYRVVPAFEASHFHADFYLRQNARVQEHLASLHIPVAGTSVLEVGAGIGDHSHYFVARGCRITITEVRDKSLEYLKRRYPTSDVRRLDMERPPKHIVGAPFDIVYSYGLLYHLNNPAEALAFFRENTGRMLLLETCVSFGEEMGVNLTEEPQKNPTQAHSGMGCRPTRPWLWDELRKLYPHVYVPRTQPNHEQFPVDWNAPKEHEAALQRAIFVASLEPVCNEMLVPELLMQQTRHD